MYKNGLCGLVVTVLLVAAGCTSRGSDHMLRNVTQIYAMNEAYDVRVDVYGSMGVFTITDDEHTVIRGKVPSEELGEFIQEVQALPSAVGKTYYYELTAQKVRSTSSDDALPYEKLRQKLDKGVLELVQLRTAVFGDEGTDTTVLYVFDDGSTLYIEHPSLGEKKVHVGMLPRATLAEIKKLLPPIASVQQNKTTDDSQEGASLSFIRDGWERIVRINSEEDTPASTVYELLNTYIDMYRPKV